MRPNHKLLILLSLSLSLGSLTLLGCTSDSKPRVIEDNDRGGGGGGGGGGSSKPVEERGYNGLAYTYLSQNLAQYGVRLYNLAMMGEKSAELLKCQKLTKTSEKNDGLEYSYKVDSIPRQGCELDLVGSELIEVKKNKDNKIMQITSKNARGLELTRSRSTPSRSQMEVTDIRIADLTLNKNASDTYDLNATAIIDVQIRAQNSRNNIKHEIEVVLSGLLDIQSENKIYFQLIESIISHRTQRQGFAKDEINTRIVRVPDTSDNESKLVICGTANGVYQTEQSIKVGGKTILAAPQIEALGGVLKNGVSNRILKPTRYCDTSFYRLAEATALAILPDKNTSFSAIGARRSGNRGGNSTPKIQNAE